MMTEEKLDALVKQLFAEIQFTREPAGLYDPLRYMIQIGGKRIRPRLCLLCYSLFKDTFDESILSPAQALEVFHTFTLLHDDIMDKSPLRRGMPTVWTKWNSDTAILSGDVMSIDSYARVAKAPASVLGDVLGLFSTTAAQVCDGQQYDMEFESVDEVPMEEYMKMIGLKTAVLIACSAKMGALIAGASKQDCDNIYSYAYQLGLAFQIADDYLDAYGDEKVFGKPIGGDILNAKKSWLNVRASQKAADKKEFFTLLNSTAGTAEQKAAKIAAVKKIYDALDVPSEAKAEIRRLTARAMEFAGKLNIPEEGKEQLGRFADRLVGRAY